MHAPGPGCGVPVDDHGPVTEQVSNLGNLETMNKYPGRVTRALFIVIGSFAIA
jgi:hypothetical protein